MSSENRSGGPSEPPEKDVPRARRVPPYDPNPALITYWEAGETSVRGFRGWWRRLFGINGEEPERF
jgi:hypothetical protein